LITVDRAATSTDLNQDGREKGSRRRENKPGFWRTSRRDNMQKRLLAAFIGADPECLKWAHKRTHAQQQTSGRAFSVVSFVYLSVERPFNKFYGINCRPKLNA
jgi:hypothetical protein